MLLAVARFSNVSRYRKCSGRAGQGHTENSDGVEECRVHFISKQGKRRQQKFVYLKSFAASCAKVIKHENIS